MKSDFQLDPRQLGYIINPYLIYTCFGRTPLTLLAGDGDGAWGGGELFHRCKVVVETQCLHSVPTDILCWWGGGGSQYCQARWEFGFPTKPLLILTWLTGRGVPGYSYSHGFDSHNRWSGWLVITER